MSKSSSMFLMTIISQSRRTILYEGVCWQPLEIERGRTSKSTRPNALETMSSVIEQRAHQAFTHLSLVQVSANRTSRSERVWVLGVGFSESTVTISNLCLVSASLASKGKLGVDIITSGYLDPVCFKLSFNTRAAAKYEFFVRSVTYAFLGTIFSGLGWMGRPRSRL